MSKETDERSTPQEFFDKLNSIFQFNLDSCATKENTKCEKYWTIDDDGLKQDWASSTFCNPPYSHGQPIKWVTKAYNESFKNNNSVLILKSDTSTKAFHQALDYCDAMFAMKDRLKFNGNSNTAMFATIIVIYGYDIKYHYHVKGIFKGSWLKIGE
jgi:phage N-6-adenine-methyltransferase